MTSFHGMLFKIDGNTLRWSDEKNHEDWTPREDNSAGDLWFHEPICRLELERGKLFVQLPHARWKVNPLGPPFFFGTELITKSACEYCAAENPKDKSGSCSGCGAK